MRDSYITYRSYVINSLCHYFLFLSWVSVLQNSKEEALNNAFKDDQNEGENNTVRELTKAIVGEVKKMSGNDVCCDCGASSKRYDSSVVVERLHMQIQ